MDNLPTHVWKRFEGFREDVAFVQPGEDGALEEVEYARWTLRVRRIALGLMEAGFEPDTRVGIVAPNSMAWMEIAFAAWLVGGCVVPLPSGRRREETLRCLARSGCDWIALQNESDLDMLRGQGGSLPEHLRWITLEELGGAREETAFDLDGLYESGKHRDRRGGVKDLAKISFQLPTDLPALILFPFDPGEEPSGAFFTGGKLAAMLEYLSGDLRFEEDDRLAVMASYGWHYGLLIALAALYAGRTLLAAETLGELGDELSRMRPTMMISGPAYIEGRMQQWQERIEEAPDLLDTFGDDQAFGFGRALAAIGERAAEKIVHAPIRRSFGGDLKRLYLLGGTAPEDVLDMLENAGIPVLGMYGRPEFGVSHIERPGARRRGSVGRPVQGYACKIAGARSEESGEILIRSDVAFEGYWTSDGPRKVDEEGWIHTGDVGRIESGFLRLDELDE